jgi:hypothetical protein
LFDKLKNTLLNKYKARVRRDIIWQSFGGICSADETSGREGGNDASFTESMPVFYFAGRAVFM